LQSEPGSSNVSLDAARPQPSDGPGPSRPQEAESRARRQLARLRFDLHDGPQQDLILLGEDLRLLHEQLEQVVEETPARQRLLGHLDDLHARLVAVDTDLRRISTLMVSPFLPDESFNSAFSGLIDDFVMRTRVEPATTIEGDFGALTDSQRITLLALIQEALHNIREHSGARRVQISVIASNGAVQAEITDDGCGFDLDSTYSRAVIEGHLGLVGMHERVQMLGGTTNIESRPGGPTIISVRLPSVDIVPPAG
jgi:two-component system sensor histidine kinase UhpB